MDQNLNQAAQPVPPQNTQNNIQNTVPEVLVNNPKSSNKMVFILLAIILLAVSGVTVYFLVLKKSGLDTTLNTTNKTQNVTINKPTPTTVPIDESKINTDTQLDKDTAIIDDNLNTLGTDVNNIDQGLSIQQTNIQ